jgi:hypothetical protein
MNRSSNSLTVYSSRSLSPPDTAPLEQSEPDQRFQHVHLEINPRDKISHGRRARCVSRA